DRDCHASRASRRAPVHGTLIAAPIKLSCQSGRSGMPHFSVSPRAVFAGVLVLFAISSSVWLPTVNAQEHRRQTPAPTTAPTQAPTVGATSTSQPTNTARPTNTPQPTSTPQPTNPPPPPSTPPPPTPTPGP